MMSQKLAIQVQAAMYLGYGVGFLFAPSTMFGMYMNQSSMNEMTEVALKFCGAANILWGLSMLAVIDNTSKAMRRCIQSILMVGNVMFTWLMYSNKHLYQQQGLYQGILMHVAFLALNLFSGEFVKPKSS